MLRHGWPSCELTAPVRPIVSRQQAGKVLRRKAQSAALNHILNCIHGPDDAQLRALDILPQATRVEAAEAKPLADQCKGAHVHQVVALPAAEISSTIDVAAASTALEARQSLSPAAEAGRGVRERHELVDCYSLTVAIGDAVHEAQAVGLGDHVDRARSLPAARPRER
jgi:hypothetical protein